MRMFWILLAAMVLPAPSSAQSQADSAAVILVAWDRLVGSAPFPHPEGATRLACFSSGPMGRPSDFEDLSMPVQETVARTLTDGRAVELTTGCKVDLSTLPADGSMVPMLDAEGRAAVDVQLFLLELETPTRAEVGLHVGAGGRWGEGSRCTLERRPDGGWAVGACRSVVRRQ